jgi:3-oxoacyl-[acyl-carrier protein] reductase
MTADLPEAELRAMIPLRRFGKTDEIAGAISFLCGPDAAYITRQVISVNGGML